MSRKLLPGVAVGLFALACLPPLLPTAALAKDAEGRFTMQQTDDGMLRLDTQTGALSLCASENGDWQCATISEDKSAQQSEIDRLIAENTALRREVERLATLAGSSLDGGLKSVPGNPGATDMPSDAEVDKFFGFAEKLIKRFKGLVDKLNEPDQPGMPL